jgi:SAM-dependent MidA family methyltransferase
MVDMKNIFSPLMPFVDFMQKALYDPNMGYYQSDRPKWGSSGDFITAPELTPLFGQSVAEQCRQIFPELSAPVIFELGAGSGQLCIDILSHLEQEKALPQAYWILEVSAASQRQQKRNIKNHLPHLFDKIRWLNTWPQETYEGIIIANEVLDAMPVHRFMLNQDHLWEQYVAYAENKFTFVAQRCEDERLLAYLDKVLPKHLPQPYLSEANLWIEGWLASGAEALKKGAFLIFDYGYPRHELYHPDRSQGTLLCHYRHKVHADPLIYVGEQDITAHVDFTHVAEAAEKVGFDLAGYTSQAAFLINNGLLNLLEKRANVDAQQAVKKLLHPHEMGELFKVIALTKQLKITLNGMNTYDRPLL